MKIRYVNDDLMSHPGRFILQGCNAQGVMGSGVAKLIRDAYPRNFTIYRKEYEANGLPLGSVVVADCGRFVFLNGITQEFYGRDGKLYANYDAIDTVFSRCNELMRNEIGTNDVSSKPIEIAMPLIGAGLAGGDWKKISALLEARSFHFQPVVYIQELEQYSRIANPTSA